jgi:3-oxoacyl-[acyl-carrier protein] reductase
MTESDRELAGKVAIVTGSARNIGRAIAEELARAGAAVTINALKDIETARAVAQGICDQGGRAIAQIANIADPDAVDGLVGATVEAFGGVDILINNAALRSTVDFVDLTWEEWVRVRSVALDGAFLMSMASVPHMIARGGGSVVGIGGLNSVLGAAKGAHKSATKDGMCGLIRGMATDLGRHNINCNIAVVGVFDTDRASGSGALIARGADTPIPMGRKGVGQDMADTIRFLVGPKGRYITGQTIHVNGGAFLAH